MGIKVKNKIRFRRKIKILKYSENNKDFRELLNFLKKIEKEFTPPLSSYMLLKEYLNRLATKGNIIYLKENRKILGLIGYFDYDERYSSAYIMVVFTGRELRGEGYADLLLKKCLDDYKKRNIKKIKLTVSSNNKPAISLYNKHGFEVIKIKRNDRGEGIHTLILELNLKNFNNTIECQDEKLNKKFSKIKKYYKKIDKTKIKNRTFIRSTKSGVFGPSDCDVVFNLFRTLELQRYKNFIDLGSGDGRVVLIASLFTKAVGFETDKKLNNLAKKARKDLNLKADFKTEDYFKEDLAKYDVLFIYPSKSEDEKFKKKILNELQGLLIDYKIYFPRYLKKVISFIDDETKIYCYVKKGSTKNKYNTFTRK